MPPELMTFVERFGSFGLLAVALLWGGPKLLTFLRDQRQEFTAAIREMRAAHESSIAGLVARHESRIDKIYQEHSEWQRATNDVVTRLADRVGEMTAMVETCPSRHPLPVGRGSPHAPRPPPAG